MNGTGESSLLDAQLLDVVEKALDGTPCEWPQPHPSVLVKAAAAHLTMRTMGEALEHETALRWRSQAAMSHVADVLRWRHQDADAAALERRLVMLETWVNIDRRTLALSCVLCGFTASDTGEILVAARIHRSCASVVAQKGSFP